MTRAVSKAWISATQQIPSTEHLGRMTSLPAPIAKGTKLGSAAVTLPDGRVIEYPLEAGADVPRASFVGRMVGLARHYLLGWWS